MAITRERFTEGSSGFIRGQSVDQAGDPMDVGVLTAATLTLYDMETGEILNDRDAQSLLSGGSPETGTNDVTFEADGYFRWDLQAGVPGASPEDLGDNPIVTSRRQVERHRAMFRFVWTGGAFNYEVELEVVNLRKVI
jgi:hypothetical protein